MLQISIYLKLGHRVIIYGKIHIFQNQINPDSNLKNQLFNLVKYFIYCFFNKYLKILYEVYFNQFGNVKITDKLARLQMNYFELLMKSDVICNNSIFYLSFWMSISLIQTKQKMTHWALNLKICKEMRWLIIYRTFRYQTCPNSF